MNYNKLVELINFISELNQKEISNLANKISEKEYQTLKSKLENLANSFDNILKVMTLIEPDFGKRLELIPTSIERYINKQKETLKNSTKLLADEKSRLVDEGWIKSSINKINQNLSNQNSIESFGQQLLDKVENIIGINVGLFYGISKNDNFSFSLISTLGIDPKNVKQQSIPLDHSFVGRLIFKQKVYQLIPVPDDFSRIDTGLTDCLPKSVFYIPLIHNGESLGLLIIHALEEFYQRTISLLNLIPESIGLSLKSVYSNVVNKELTFQIQEKNKSLESQKEALDSSAIVAETDSRGKITYVNKKFIDISGYSESELIGQDHRILNSGYHEKSFFINLWKTISSGKIWTGEIKNKSKKGAYYWVDTTIYPVKTSTGKISKFIAIRFETTDKKRALEQIESDAKKFEEVSRIKTNFLSNMSHELRTPMNSIIGMIDLLKEEDDIKDNPYIDALSSASDSLLSVVNDILDMQKIESGKIEIERDLFDLDSLVSETIHIMIPLASKNKVKLDLSFDYKIQPLRIGSYNHIKQILVNLIANGIKFSKGKSVTLDVKSDLSNSDVIQFTIKDTGIGMSSEKLSTIFNRFEQGSAGITKKFGGTGLGLSISKELLLLMGSDLSVSSQEGRGSEFSFSLRLDTDHYSDGIFNQYLNHKNLSDKKALICGSLYNQKFFIDLLNHWGCSVDIDSEIRKHSMHKFDYIFSEISLINNDNYYESLLSPVGKIYWFESFHTEKPARKPGKFSIPTLKNPVSRTDLIALINNKTGAIKKSVLMLDDDSDFLDVFEEMIPDQFNVFKTTDPDVASRHLIDHKIDFFFCDEKISKNFSGSSFLHTLSLFGFYADYILVSGYLNSVNQPPEILVIEKPVEKNQILDILHVTSQGTKENSSKKKNKAYNIMIVDDSKENLFVLESYYSKIKNYRTNSFENPNKAIEEFKKNTYDLILLDIHMPEIDGYKALEKFREIEAVKKRAKCKIILLSANASSENIEKSVNLHADGYLTKPIRKHLLIKATSKALSEDCNEFIDPELINKIRA